MDQGKELGITIDEGRIRTSEKPKYFKEIDFEELRECIEEYGYDATVADQGSATTRGDRSLKDLIDTIGTSLMAEIVLPNSALFILCGSLG